MCAALAHGALPHTLVHSDTLKYENPSLHACELTHSSAPIDSPIGAVSAKWCVFLRISTRAAAWEAGLFLLISHISFRIHRGTHATLRDQAVLEKNGAFTQKGKAPNGGEKIIFD